MWPFRTPTEIQTENEALREINEELRAQNKSLLGEIKQAHELRNNYSTIIHEAVTACQKECAEIIKKHDYNRRDYLECKRKLALLSNEDRRLQELEIYKECHRKRYEEAEQLREELGRIKAERDRLLRFLDDLPEGYRFAYEASYKGKEDEALTECSERLETIKKSGAKE